MGVPWQRRARAGSKRFDAPWARSGCQAVMAAHFPYFQGPLAAGWTGGRPEKLANDSCRACDVHLTSQQCRSASTRWSTAPRGSAPPAPPPPPQPAGRLSVAVCPGACHEGLTQ
ncbi:hypothetical protein AQF52_6726 [Streptomyces venezuelae]|nr:hypothetical protein AQF52_6726 [Streptomyces venezuelae]